MSHIVIQAENLGKKYRLGTLNQKMLGLELESWWARFCGKEDPNSSVHDAHRNVLPKPYDFWALSDVNFKIYKGDSIGLMGVNGSGKSTLLKLLSRITAPSTGVIKLKGRVVSLLEVGTGFHQELTGRENVFLNGAILGMKRKEVQERYDNIVEFSGVEKFMDVPVKRYSSGMRIRLAFSVAAHVNPDILILDEILTVGDAKFQEKCLEKIEDTKKKGTTLILVSHSAQQILTYCNRTLILEKGRLVADSPAREGVEIYLNSLDLQHPQTQIGGHSDVRRGEILGVISQLFFSNLQNGSVVMECPVKTENGICRVDVGWIPRTRQRTLERSSAYSSAPDICVHLVSAEHALAEINQTIPLLFRNGAIENWVCDMHGNLAIYRNGTETPNSEFFDAPKTLELNY